MSTGLDPTLRDLTDSDCCEGVTIHTPARIYNQPGLSAILYRSGTHPRFKQTMLARLSGRKLQAALKTLTTRDDDDFAISLLDAWATVADVLTFYQERIAHESYLRTAGERLSIWHLARLIGYELRPGVAAAAYLAFTVDEAPSAPAVVTIPAGAQAQSIPSAQDELPQPFETMADIEARAEWNELLPRLTRPQDLTFGATQLYLALRGSATNLRTGDMLLFLLNVDDLNPEEGVSEDDWEVRRLTAVVPDHTMGRTLVTWQNGLSSPQWPEDWESISEPFSYQIFVFRQRANIFGHNAPDWRTMPDIAKATYLGLDDPAELIEEEKIEWPNFVINAPIYPHDPLPAAPMIRLIYPTPESVAQAAIAVADGMVNAAVKAAAASIPNAIMKTVQAVTTILDEVVNLGGLVGAEVEQAHEGLEDVLKDLVRFLHSLLSKFAPDVAGLVGDTLDFTPPDITEDWEDIFATVEDAFHDIQQRLNSIGGLVATAAQMNPIDENFENIFNASDFSTLVADLQDMIRKNPLLAPLNALWELKEDVGDSFANISTAVTEAVDAVAEIPQAIAKAGGAFIIANVVKTAVTAVMKTPIKLPGIDEPLIPLTPELVAFVARYAAKLGLLALALNPGTPLDDVITAIQSFIVEDQTTGGAGIAAITGTAGVVAGGTLVAGATVTGIAVGVGVVAGPGIAAALGATLLPLVAPLLLAGIALAIVAEDIVGGARDVEQAVTDAVAAALIPKKELRPKRRDHLALTDDTIDLDDIYAKITPGSWMLLSLPDKEENGEFQEVKALYGVEKIAEASRSDFTLNGKTSRATLRGADFSPRFKITAASLDNLESEKLPDDILDGLRELEDQSFAGEESFLEELRDKIGDDHDLALYWVSVFRYTEEEIAFRKEVRMTTVFGQNEALEPAEEPWEEPVSGSTVTLDRPVDCLSPERLLLVSGMVSDPPEMRGEHASEAVTLKKSGPEETHPECTELVFEKRLRYSYKRDTVVIYANVATATHGESKQEVLGSGDGSRAFQSFTLREAPLTYVPAENERGAATTLEIRVNDILWEEASSRHELDFRQRSYVTQTDNEGRTTITFGDGQHGARLPTGQENVTAEYRVGIGRAGNVPANQISLLTKRPFGVRNVFNPLSAGGGGEPESMDQARRNAPLTVLTMDRIVSLKDYEDFAGSFAGINKALATWPWSGQGHVVFLTIAGPDGAAVPDQTIENLKASIRRFGDHHIPLEVESYKQVHFTLKSKLITDHSYLKEKVLDAARLALLEHFAFEARDLGQTVTLSEVSGVVQGVPGVIAVDVDALHRTGEPAGVEPVMAATTPLLGNDGRLIPAELLMLKPEDLALGVV